MTDWHEIIAAVLIALLSLAVSFFVFHFVSAEKFLYRLARILNT